jgi:hypothetical protein
MTALNERIEKQLGWDFAQITPRLAAMRECYRLMHEGLLKIVYLSPEPATEGMSKPLVRERVKAVKSDVMFDLALLKVEIETGTYKKPIKALAEDIRYAPLPPEMRMVAIAAWQRGGLLPAATIETMVPLAAS